MNAVEELKLRTKLAEKTKEELIQEIVEQAIEIEELEDKYSNQRSRL